MAFLQTEVILPCGQQRPVQPFPGSSISSSHKIHFAEQHITVYNTPRVLCPFEVAQGGGCKCFSLWEVPLHLAGSGYAPQGVRIADDVAYLLIEPRRFSEMPHGITVALLHSVCIAYAAMRIGGPEFVIQAAEHMICLPVILERFAVLSGNTVSAPKPAQSVGQPGIKPDRSKKSLCFAE